MNKQLKALYNFITEKCEECPQKKDEIKGLF